MERKVKKLQVMSNMLAILWAIMFVANVVMEITFWYHYGEFKNLVVAPFVVLLLVSCSWIIISVLHFRQARVLGTLENPEAIYLQKSRIKSKLVAAMVILILSMPLKIAIHGYMDTVVYDAQDTQAVN